MRKLIAQLKHLKQGEVKPSEEWLQNNRALLLSQIKNTVAPQEETKINFDGIWNTLSLFVPRALVFNVVRPLAVLLIVSIVATSGWVTSVDAAYNALPGDWLYPAKRAAEKTQVVVAGMVGSKETEIKLHAEFAKRRATETKQMVQKNDPKKQEQVKELVQDTKNEIANVDKKLEETKIASANNTVSADAVKDIKKDTEQVKNTLQEVKATLLAASTVNDTTSTLEVAKAVNEAKDMAKDTTVKATEVIVAKHLEGDTSVTTEEVKKELNTVLQSVTTDAASSVQSVAGVQAVVTAAKTEVKGLIGSPAANTSSTVALNQKITAVVSSTNEAAIQTKTATDNVDKNVTEAVNALNKGDLTAAIENLQKANVSTKEAEKISNQMVTEAQQLVPATPIIVSAPEVLKDIKVIINTTTINTNTPAVLPPITVVVPTTPVTPIVPKQ